MKSILGDAIRTWGVHAEAEFGLQFAYINMRTYAERLLDFTVLNLINSFMMLKYARVGLDLRFEGLLAACTVAHYQGVYVQCD
jgi:hypothetical protein